LRFWGFALSAALLSIGCEPTAPELGIATIDIYRGYVGSPYQGKLNAVGGAGNYEWTILKGGIPGVTLSHDGYLRGIPTAAGRWSMVVRVQSGGQSGQREVSVPIHNDPLRILPDTFPHAQVGTLYRTRLDWQGGVVIVRRYGYTVTEGELPAGLTIVSNPEFFNEAPFYLTGVPQTAGVTSFTLRLIRGVEPADTAYQSYRFVVLPH
jgi:hypothetical protein